MLNDSGTDLDVQRLMHEIRANVANRHRPAEAVQSRTAGQSNGNLNGNNRYHVNDLLRFHGDEFVRNAYRALLRREPDEAGLAKHLELLASGRFNKLDVLASLHSSSEGRNSGVKLDGLSLPVAVRRMGRLPLIGYVVRLVVAIIRLPLLIQHQNRFEFYTWSQQRSIIAHQDQHYTELRETLQQISAQILENTQRAAEQQQANELFLRQYEELIAKHEEFEERLAENRKLSAEATQNYQQLLNQHRSETQHLREDLKSTLLRQQKTDIGLLMQERRLTILLEQLKGTAASPSLKEAASEEEEHLLDALYASFEDQFRGPREEVSRRLEVYLPSLKEAEINDGVLDIGSGRGEWLQLLHSEGIEARGVDHNRVFIEECLSAGLKVIEEDAVIHLRSLPDDTLNAVTIFHLVEHLPFEVLIRLLNEVVRTLKPGGMLIVETPNPENFMVGSCSFYADPTHRNPIPSQTLQFLLESRGLCDLTILKLRAWDEAKIPGDGELIKRFNEYFYSAPDYGIIARKP
jgi:SAM-dependent methyltransferase